MKRININKISIKWQLFAYFSLFAGVTLVLLWLFQVVFLQSFYRNIKISDIKKTADQIAANIDRTDLSSYLRSVAMSSESNILITDMDGNELYSSNAGPSDGMSSLSSEDVGDMIRQARQSSGTYSEWLDDNGLRNNTEQPANFSGQSPPPQQQHRILSSIVYTKIVHPKSGSQEAIILNANIQPVDATVLTIRTQLLYVTFIMLVFALVLAFLLSRRISGPIVRINESAKELAHGNYETAFDGKGYREIAELNGTLNYAAKELTKTENLRRDLIANISHDLRTPLTMITGYAEVMRDLPGENSSENIQVIIDEANRLTSLVNDVLDISKLQSSAEELRPVVFNLTQSIRSILLRYTKLTEQEGYTIKFFQNGDAFIRGDELRVSQVVYNLVNNAITYTGRDKMVIVRQNVSEKSVRIEIIDTGDGIPEEKLPLIWDRYYKVDKAHKRAAVGTGLGLSIVKTILDLHHARYGVQSTPGQGSVFWFEFARQAGPIPQANPAREADPARRTDPDA